MHGKNKIQYFKLALLLSILTLLYINWQKQISNNLGENVVVNKRLINEACLSIQQKIKNELGIIRSQNLSGDQSQVKRVAISEELVSLLNEFESNLEFEFDKKSVDIERINELEKEYLRRIWRVHGFHSFEEFDDSLLEEMNNLIVEIDFPIKTNDKSSLHDNFINEEVLKFSILIDYSMNMLFA